MSDKEEPTSPHGTPTATSFIGQIRRLSRRLSGNILSADAKDVRAYHQSRNAIYYHDKNDDQLKINGVELKDLAEEYDTPLYVYDLNRMVDNYNLYIGSLKLIKSFLLCYAVKANSNLTILNAFSQLGAGFDVVSGGEIVRCLTAGVDPNKIVFSGCGKSDKELELAVSSGIHCINVESWEELDRLEVVALKLNKIQNISIRINPGIALEGLSHSNILTGSQGNKFGVPIGEALDIYNRAKASPSLKIKGISCHLGSNINQLDPFIEARDKLLDLADELRTELKICVEHINLGGGFGAQIESNLHTPDIPQWVEKLGKPISERGLRLILEPGRSLVADAGVLLTKVEYIKTAHKGSTVTTPPRSGSILGSHHEKKPHHETPKTIAIVDAGFNDYMRTALYGYQPNIVPTVIKHHDLPGFTSEFKYDIVGPVCETTDTFYKGFTTNQKLEVGDYLIFTDVGAYGASMASNYNSRNKVAQVIINDNRPVLICDRQKYESQFQDEKIVTDLRIKNLETVKESESLEDVVNNNV